MDEEDWIRSLIERARQGDQGAVTELLEWLQRKQKDYLTRQLRRRGVREDDLEDAVHDVLVLSEEKIRGPAKSQIRLFHGHTIPELRGFVFRIAQTVARMYRNRYHRPERPFSDLQHENPNDPDYAPPLEFPNHDVAPESYKDLMIDFQKVLNQLPIRQKKALFLRDMEGYSFEEVAGLLGCSVKTAKEQIYKARRALRGFLTLFGITAEIQCTPSRPNLGDQVTIGVKLQNDSYGDADVGVRVYVDAKELGHTTAHIPLHGNVEVHDVSRWVARRGNYSIRVILNIDSRLNEFQKTLIVGGENRP